MLIMAACQQCILPGFLGNLDHTRSRFHWQQQMASIPKRAQNLECLELYERSRKFSQASVLCLGKYSLSTVPKQQIFSPVKHSSEWLVQSAYKSHL